MLFNKKTILITVFTFVSVSLFGVMLMTINRFWNFEGTPDGWLGYWGGVIGSAIGVIGALFVMQSQLKSDQEVRKEEKIDNTFFNLLNLFNSIQNEILTNDPSHFDSIHKYMLKKKLIYINKLEEKKAEELLPSCKEIIINGQELLSEGLSIVTIENKKVSWSSNDFMNMNSLELNKQATRASKDDKELEDLKKRKNKYDQTLNCIQLLKTFLVEEEFTLDDYENYKTIINYGDRLRDILQDLDLPILTDLKSWLQELIIEMNKYSDIKLNELEKRTIISDGLRLYYSKTGKYFRMFHRIVKYVNDNVTDAAQRKNYIGFLRAVVNEVEMIVLYYNAFFTERGLGLGNEIKRTEFYGNEKDLMPGKISHFSEDLLLWEEDDLEKMRAFQYD